MSDAEKRLEVFQDLNLRGPASKRSALRTALIAQISPPWHHPKRRKPICPDPTEATDSCSSETLMRMAAAALFLWSCEDGYEVTNIVPTERNALGSSGYLGYSGYSDFRIWLYASLDLLQIRKVSELILRLRCSPDDWLPEKVANALRRFWQLANKSTGLPSNGSRPLVPISKRRPWER